MRHSSTSTSARRHSVRTGGTIALALALVWGTTAVAMAAPAPARPAPVANSEPRAFGEAPLHPRVVHAPVIPVRPAATWTIQIDTVGHQDELDQCLWVRMDFTATAPIVGMHNFCGGDFVLDMMWGQTVQLVGQGLDGTYLVTTDRAAFPGDSPSGVTAGIVATVFLQTCYWDIEQGMRLVALTLLPAVPRVVAGAS